MMNSLRAKRHERLLELDEVERRLKPFGRRYLGVCDIPVDALVGTQGRVSSFTRDFRPLLSSSRDRMRSLQDGFAERKLRIRGQVEPDDPDFAAA